MFEFVIYAVIMLLIAVAFVVVPMFLSAAIAPSSDQAANVQLARAKLRELKAELAAGSIGQTTFDNSRRELEAGLYHDLHDGNAVQTFNQNGRWLALLLGFGIPVLSLALYAQWGDVRSFEAAGHSANNDDKPARSTENQINDMVDRLAQRLQQQPDDLQGWIMLSRSYKAMKRFDDAAAAMRRALALQNSPEIMLQLADTLAIAHGGNLDGEPSRLIEQALAMDPENKMGLWLSGLHKAKQGQYEAAIRQWQTAQQRYRAGDEEFAELQDLINEAQKRAGLPLTAAPSAVPPTKPAAGIEVTVSLDKSLAAGLDADDSVLIYAKAANGPKMPLAAVKRSVKELPVSIRLDDNMAMMPNLKISKFDHLVIGARVSRTGDAMPQSGDLIGSEEWQKGQSNTVNVVINRSVP